MPASLVRPDVAELVFRLFGRSVHPELFDIRAVATITLESYQATVGLCDAGHLVIEIGFAPLRPAEFVILRIGLRARPRGDE